MFTIKASFPLFEKHYSKLICCPISKPCPQTESRERSTTALSRFATSYIGK